MKRCPDCGQWKALDQFPRNKNSKDGRHSYCKPCHNARGKEPYERSYGGTRHYHLKRRYGIGADEFDELVVRQGGVCAICGRPDPEHLDHDHETGAVRGVLCCVLPGSARRRARAPELDPGSGTGAAGRVRVAAFG
jgi:hypothetical protein